MRLLLFVLHVCIYGTKGVNKTVAMAARARASRLIYLIDFGASQKIPSLFSETPVPSTNFPDKRGLSGEMNNFKTGFTLNT